MLLVYVLDAALVDADLLAGLKAVAAKPMAPVVVLVAAKAGTATQGIRVLEDRAGRFAERFDAAPGSTYLIRPDQHVAARWRSFDAAQVSTALARATCNLS